jgi:2-polyprenyl-3-methyl-5-hydroxy-6-metoxy-1,4-benzoquinol methylase
MERRIRAEVMDVAADAKLERVLRDLERINHWFGGETVARRALAGIVARQEAFTLLDVGAASGEMGRAIERAYPNARVYNLDRQVRHLARAGPRGVAGNAFEPPFAERSFDVVFCSLFLHHFEEAEVGGLLRSMYGLARRAVVAVDLERSRIARSFLPWTQWLMGWDAITTHDGVRSVEAGFTRAELARIAWLAGLNDVEVRSHAPWFRLTLVSKKQDGPSPAR